MSEVLSLLNPMTKRPFAFNEYYSPEFDTTEAFRAKFLKSDPLISRISGFGSEEKTKKA